MGCSLKSSLRAATSVGAASLLAVCATTASGQCEIDKLVPRDGSSGDSLGDEVDIYDDVAIIGGFWTNAAYIYRIEGSTWCEEAILAHDGTTTSSVAIGDGVAAVGDVFDDTRAPGAGAVYVFRFDPGLSLWAHEAKLFASDSDEADFFGSSVALSGGRLVVGADGGDEAAYVFQYDGSKWTEQARLSIGKSALYGGSVGIDGDIVVVGAAGVNESAGAAYVYRFDGSEWVQEAELHDEDGQDDDLFGRSVAISGNTVVTGAHGDSAGSVFIFRFDGSSWIEEAKLVQPDDEFINFNFGASVSIRGDVVIIGMVSHSENGLWAGATYVSRHDGLNWPEPTKLLASDGAVNDSFGRDVAVDGDLAIVGADGDDLATGAAYIFVGVSGVDCNGNDVADACDLDEGTSDDADGNGVPDECDCHWDLDGSGDVGALDLVALIQAWGSAPAGPPDFDADGSVGVLDLVDLILHWGSCG